MDRVERQEEKEIEDTKENKVEMAEMKVKWYWEERKTKNGINPTREEKELRDWRAVLDDLLLCGSQKVGGRMQHESEI